MFALGCCLVKVVTSLSSIIIIMTSILGVLTFGVKLKKSLSANLLYRIF